MGCTNQQNWRELARTAQIWTKYGTDFKTETCSRTLEPSPVEPPPAPSKNHVQTCLFEKRREQRKNGPKMQQISKPKPVLESLSHAELSPHPPH